MDQATADRIAKAQEQIADALTRIAVALEGDKPWPVKVSEPVKVIDAPPGIYS